MRQNSRMVVQIEATAHSLLIDMFTEIIPQSFRIHRRIYFYDVIPNKHILSYSRIILK